MKVKVVTLFDCTATGVIGHYRHEKLPITLPSGEKVIDYPGWMKARNQQRNWETVTQLLQLRSQILLDEVPHRNELGQWEFEFEVERSDTYNNDNNPFKLLQEDCEKVPIVVGLTESDGCEGVIRTQGAEQNIWFQVIE